MNRRGFLQMFGMAVGGLAIEQAIPFGRVWSFPSKIVLVKPIVEPMPGAITLEMIQEAFAACWNRPMLRDTFYVHPYDVEATRQLLHLT